MIDEVGRNAIKNGDVNDEVEHDMCKRISTPHRNMNTNDKHGTVLGLTTISGKPGMFINVFCC